MDQNSGFILDGVYKVIQLLKDFSLKKLKNGKKLSESDFFLNSIGELMIKYKSALQLCEYAGNLIAEFEKGEKSSLERIFEASVIAKYFSTHYSEEIISKVRHTMGTKFLSSNSLTNKVYKEIAYGILQPMTDIDIRDYFSKSIMNNNEI